MQTDLSGMRPPLRLVMVVILTAGLLAPTVMNLPSVTAAQGQGVWKDVAPMVAGRSKHTATTLKDGRVLVTGGSDEGMEPTATAEIYDPRTGTWKEARSMNFRRAGHSAVLLDGASCDGGNPPNWCGKVLVVGGDNASLLTLFVLMGPQTATGTSAEIYDPSTNVWSVLPNGFFPAHGTEPAPVLFPLREGRVLGVSDTGTLNRDPAGAISDFQDTVVGEPPDQQRSMVFVPDQMDLSRSGWTPTAVANDPHDPEWRVSPVPGQVTRLRDNRVLIFGSWGMSDSVAIFDGGAQTNQLQPPAQPWSRAEDLPDARYLPSVNVLDGPVCSGANPPDWCGKVLLAGGYFVSGGEWKLTTTTFLYDPEDDGWTQGPHLPAARAGHTVVGLGDGSLVLWGGQGPGSQNALAYWPDGAEDDAWKPTDAPLMPNDGTPAVVPGGNILLSGGTADCTLMLDKQACRARAAQLYEVVGTDPAVNRPVVFGLSPDFGPVEGGTRVIIRGRDFQGTVDVFFGSERAQSVAEVSDTEVVAVTPPGGVGSVPVLVTTVRGVSTGALRFRYLEDPGGRWMRTGGMTFSRGEPALAVMNDGKVLVSGGRAWGHGSDAPTSAEIYDPKAVKDGVLGQWSGTASMNVGRQRHTLTPLEDGRVLAAGGAQELLPDLCVLENALAEVPDCLDRNDYASAEVFLPPDPGSEDPPEWAPTAPMTGFRDGHTATRLDGPGCRAATRASWCGRVLVAGGLHQPTAEVFVPEADAWVPTAPMQQGMNRHTATLLDGPPCLTDTPPGWCGKVLVVGANLDNEASAQLYDPESASWSEAAAPSRARRDHVAAQLPTGDVLIAGGQATATSGLLTPTPVPTSAELYDPDMDEWRPTGPMVQPREQHMIAAVPGGRLLLAGGLDERGATHGDAGALADAEIFDPSANGGSGAFFPTDPMQLNPRRGAAAVVLSPLDEECGGSCRRVLVAGGFGDSGPVASAEVFSVAPAVESVTPSRGSTRGGDEVVVKGSFFSGATTVRFGDQPVACGPAPAACRVVDDTTIEVVTPARRSGRVEVAVVTDGGTSLPVPGSGFTFGAVPGPVHDLRGEKESPTRIRLQFGAAGSDGAAPPPATRYDIRQAEGPMTGLAAFEGARSLCPAGGCVFGPPEVGSGLAMVVEGLTPSTDYSYGIRAIGATDLVGPLSTVAVTTAAGVPGKITDLAANAVSDHTLELTFSAPGTDGTGPPPARSYDIRQSMTPIESDDAFAAAVSVCDGTCRFEPAEVGALIRFRVHELDSGTRYHYAVRAFDPGAVPGPRSNPASALTLPDVAAPERVTDLGASTGSLTSVILTFSAVRDGVDGPPARGYEIRQARSPIDSEDAFAGATALCGGLCRLEPSRVGQTLRLTVEDLDPESAYHYALKAVDTAGNRGPLSNPASATSAPCPSASAGVAQVVYPRGYSLVGLPAGSLLGGSSTLYGWWNEGAGGAYAARSASDPTIEGHGYWAWFPCPRAVSLASGSDHFQVALGRYRASMIANPSGTHATILTGHDFAASWDPAQNGGTGGYRLSGYRESREIPIGAGSWVFSYRNTTISLSRS